MPHLTGSSLSGTCYAIGNRFLLAASLLSSMYLSFRLQKICCNNSQPKTFAFCLRTALKCTVSLSLLMSFEGRLFSANFEPSKKDQGQKKCNIIVTCMCFDSGKNLCLSFSVCLTNHPICVLITYLVSSVYLIPQFEIVPRLLSRLYFSYVFFFPHCYFSDSCVFYYM